MQNVQNRTTTPTNMELEDTMLAHGFTPRHLHPCQGT
jgi:hypothetical protein